MASRTPELSVVELVEMIARALVDKPEQVSVTIEANEASTMVRLRTDHSDVGKIIGKEGRTARSFRIILAGISIKLGHRYSLEIVEFEG